MTVKVGFNRRTLPVEAVDERVVLVPFLFTANGASDPAASSIKGDVIDTVVHSSTGKITLTLKNKAAVCLSGKADAEVDDTTDMVLHVDRSTAVSAGTVVIKSYTGGTLTDVPANVVVHGHLIVKSTIRKRTGS